MKRAELKRRTPMCTVTPLRAKTGMPPATKPMRQSRSTGKPTREQASRWELMREIGCLACLINQQIGLPVTGMVLEHQHLTDCGRRRGHSETIELCRHHHQGDKFPVIEVGYKANAAVYGPSFGREPAAFHEMYGTDDELLEFQNDLLLIARGETA